jgi:hypothetical protein
VSAATAVGTALHAIVAKVQERKKKQKSQRQGGTAETPEPTEAEVKEQVVQEVKTAIAAQVSRTLKTSGQIVPKKDVEKMVEQKLNEPEVLALVDRAEDAVTQFQQKEEEKSQKGNVTTRTEEPFEFRVDGFAVKGSPQSLASVIITLMVFLCLQAFGIASMWIIRLGRSLSWSTSPI